MAEIALASLLALILLGLPRGGGHRCLIGCWHLQGVKGYGVQDADGGPRWQEHHNPAFSWDAGVLGARDSPDGQLFNIRFVLFQPSKSFVTLPLTEFASCWIQNCGAIHDPPPGGGFRRHNHILSDAKLLQQQFRGE